MLYKMKYIDFNMKDRSWTYYSAIILIAVGHLIHFYDAGVISKILKIAFITGFILLMINSILKKGKIHITTLIFRLVIITIILASFVPK